MCRGREFHFCSFLDEDADMSTMRQRPRGRTLILTAYYFLRKCSVPYPLSPFSKTWPVP